MKHILFFCCFCSVLPVLSAQSGSFLIDEFGLSINYRQLNRFDQFIIPPTDLNPSDADFISRATLDLNLIEAADFFYLSRITSPEISSYGIYGSIKHRKYERLRFTLGAAYVPRIQLASYHLAYQGRFVSELIKSDFIAFEPDLSLAIGKNGGFLEIGVGASLYLPLHPVVQRQDYTIPCLDNSCLSFVLPLPIESKTTQKLSFHGLNTKVALRLDISDCVLIRPYAVYQFGSIAYGNHLSRNYGSFGFGCTAGWMINKP